jgi:hypothetical protein
VTAIDQSVPGAEIVEPGLADLRRGAVTTSSPLVRRLVSFERAHECARKRAPTGLAPCSLRWVERPPGGRPRID